ncbi:ABC transporter permease [Puia sp. P3]|uniref:ABC transporter permease n=1 Tax=Puia sp. P3 TaxID=3423952 RepID=UPI003D67A9FD
MKDKDRIWHLMARKFSGEATEEELKELESWQQQHPEMTYSLQLLADLWKGEPQQKEKDAEDAFSRHLTRMTLKNLDRPAGAEKPPVPLDESPQPVQGLIPRVIHQIDLIDNYFKIAWRSLRRNKGFSAINISGLAIGLASAIVLILWIRNELTCDQFHKTATGSTRFLPAPSSMVR